MVVNGTVQSLSEYTSMPDVVAIDPEEGKFKLTLIAPKVVRVNANPVRASAIMVTLENFLCAMSYPTLKRRESQVVINIIVDENNTNTHLKTRKQPKQNIPQKICCRQQWN